MENHHDIQLKKKWWGVPEPSIILPHLVLGSRWDISNEFVEKFNIGYFICGARECDHQTLFEGLPNHVKDHKTHIKNSWMSSTPQYAPFEEAINVIQDAKENGSVCFVHCMRGRSRSASTILAYLMLKEKMSLLDAYKLVKEKRPYIGPHDDLKVQLVQLETHWLGSSTLDFESWKRLEFDLDQKKTLRQVETDSIMEKDEREDLNRERKERCHIC